MIDLTSVLDADGRDEARKLKVDDLSIQYQKHASFRERVFGVLDKTMMSCESILRYI